MEKATHYLDRFQQPHTRESKAALLKEYQEFLAMLSAEEREQARQFMQTALRPQLEKTVAELDALTEKANLVLKGKIVYEGNEYILGDWVTIADYCRLHNFKPARVQNWIDRKIVPSQNLIIIRELNNLKLLKNVLYRS